MLFEQINPYSCKTYLIVNEESKKAIMIDPVIDHFGDYIDLVVSKNLKLTHVIDTHTHADHISAGSSLKDRFDCEYIMHRESPVKCAGIRVRDRDELVLNGYKFRVLHTPGHTRDSISLILEGKIFTGDFLFLDDAGAGRDDLPGGDPGMHWQSLNKLNDLSDDLMVYPAHEYRDRKPSTLGHQRESNPHLIKRTKKEFVLYLNDLRLGPVEWMKDVLKANYTCAKDPKAVWIPIDTPACEIKGTMNKSVNETEVEYVDVVEFKKLLSDTKMIVIIDVRESYELNEELGQIESNINIPIGTLSSHLNEIEKFDGKEIIVVCRSGARATTAAQIMIKAGIHNVKVLAGGMISYRNN